MEVTEKIKARGLSSIETCKEYFVAGNEHKDLYLEADAKAKEKFGEDSLAYRTITHGIDIENMTGSQSFWNVHLDSILPSGLKVARLRDLESIYSIMGNDFFEWDNFYYTDPIDLVFRSEEDSYGRELDKKDKPVKGSIGKNQFLLDYLIEGPLSNGSSSMKKPLLVSPWGGLRALEDNSYGLSLIFDQIFPAHYDKRFSKDSRTRVDFGNGEKEILTRKDGLSRIIFSKRYLNSADGDLIHSDSGGRVVLVESH